MINSHQSRHRTTFRKSITLTICLTIFGIGQSLAQEQLDTHVKPAVSTPVSIIRQDLNSAGPGLNRESPLGIKLPEVQIPDQKSQTSRKTLENLDNPELQRIATQWPSLIIMAGISFLPAALLMTTSFVRFQITLSLLRQALGSPSVPGNQVILALSLLLSVIVMRPVGETVYQKSVKPYMEGRMTQAEAISNGVGPLKRFMVDQIIHTGHLQYLTELAEYADDVADSSSATDTSTGKKTADSQPYDLSLHVVAPAFLLSELTTALLIGFAVYLPFLIVDLVVATVLAAMGLWMMPPTLVSTPAKLILFVLADGWMLTAGALLNGFAMG